MYFNKEIMPMLPVIDMTEKYRKIFGGNEVAKITASLLHDKIKKQSEYDKEVNEIQKLEKI